MTLDIRWEDIHNKGLTTAGTTIIALAKRLTVNINSYREADTFSCELDYRNFPFDPRCLRAVGVTIHVEDRKRLFKESGALDFVTPRENQFDANKVEMRDINTKKYGNTIFVGFADSESIDFDDTNRTVKIEGRDFTALLIDAPHTGELTDYQRPLDAVIQSLLKELKTTEKMEIVNRTGETFPTLAQFGFAKTELANKKSGAKNESYWDVIQGIVTKAGLIAFVELDKLIISKPRNLYGDTPAYQFIYGRNLKTLTYKRKLGRQKGINILVRSVNLSNKTDPVMLVRIPLEATIEWCKALGIKKADQIIEKFDTQGKPVEPPEIAPALAFNVSNVASKEALVEYGQSLWEEIGRQQIEGTLSTKEMVQIQDNGVEFDITKIRNGTPINIEISQGDIKGLMEVADQDKALDRTGLASARENFLIRKGYEPIIAKAFAQSISDVKPLFYTKSVEFTIDQDSGFVMSLDFINFIAIKK